MICSYISSYLEALTREKRKHYDALKGYKKDDTVKSDKKKVDVIPENILKMPAERLLGPREAQWLSILEIDAFLEPKYEKLCAELGVKYKR